MSSTSFLFLFVWIATHTEQYIQFRPHCNADELTVSEDRECRTNDRIFVFNFYCCYCVLIIIIIFFFFILFSFIIQPSGQRAINQNLYAIRINFLLLLRQCARWNGRDCVIHFTIEYINFTKSDFSFSCFFSILICSWIASIKTTSASLSRDFICHQEYMFQRWISCVFLEVFNSSVLLLCALLLFLLLIRTQSSSECQLICVAFNVNVAYICCLCAYKVRKGDNRYWIEKCWSKRKTKKKLVPYCL